LFSKKNPPPTFCRAAGIHQFLKWLAYGFSKVKYRLWSTEYVAGIWGTAFLKSLSEILSWCLFSSVNKMDGPANPWGG
jgi:hypothetical protein